MMIVSETEIFKIDDFMNSCKQGNLQKVRSYILKLHLNPKIKDQNGWTGFHYACLNNQLSIVKFFILEIDSTLIKIRTNDEEYESGFHIACKFGHEKIVRFHLNHGFPMEAIDDCGCDGFMIACYMGRLNIVQILHEEFDREIQFHDSLHACLGPNFNIINYFLQNGYDINERGRFCGKTILHHSCYVHNLEMVKWLLTYTKIDINSRIQGRFNRDVGKTALEVAVSVLHDVNNLYFGSDRLSPMDLNKKVKEQKQIATILLEFGASLPEHENYPSSLQKSCQNRIYEILILPFFMSTLLIPPGISNIIIDFTISPYSKSSVSNLKRILSAPA